MEDIIVRRLTPLECERLQGFPDNWTDIGDWTDSKGKVHKAADSPRYKALGNSIAIPQWYWLFQKMAKYLPEDATLGSLFDGIGGFPAAWEEIHGAGTALWASEIEEFPIAVTKRHFPSMKHLGDITKLNGAEAPAVNCITGGSPCQDLSVAGKRAGLAGERSGLFMEQIRLIKEMRERDIANGRTGESVRPRFAVWENVPGALSSNGGEDFRAVLEEFVHIIDKGAVIPRPDGKWNSAGCIYGDTYSIAWRVMDAQYWGVPQRRKRIALIMDLAGQRAGEILFEREGLQGDLEPRFAPWKGVARNPDDGSASDDPQGGTGVPNSNSGDGVSPLFSAAP